MDVSTLLDDRMEFILIHPSRFVADYPHHPLVLDVLQKEALFDEFASKFTVPPLVA